MRVIICGAGQVGFSIASYLARDDNDITVIDHDPDLIGKVNAELDANGIVGHASSPDALEAAGAREADMILAVTSSDEVNMVACQVGHSLFNIPRKIARLRERSYLDPAWANLFSRAHMPIDVIISPEVEVAKAIAKRVVVPGSTHLIPLSDDKLLMVGLICHDQTPLINTPLRQLTALFPEAPVKIVGLMRGGEAIIPDGDTQMLSGDEVFIIVDAGQIDRLMSTFGFDTQIARNIIILGGGNIGACLTEELKKAQRNVNIKMIERNDIRARVLSETLPGVTILHGDGLEREILDEAGVSGAEAVVAVTNDDETNILGSLLAMQYGCERVITLVNKTAYNALIGKLGIGAVISPRATTVSSIMQYVRRGRILAVHNIRDGFGELIEAEASESCPIVNKPIADLKLPSGVLIGAVVREESGIVHMARPETVIRAGDTVIVMALEGKSKAVEKLFSVHVDLF